MKTKKTLYKITLALLTAFFTTCLVNAQTIVEKKNGGEKQSNYLFASVGVSLPVGSINDNQASSLSAYAGPVISLGYHHFFHKRWGMGLAASGSIYKSKSVTQHYGSFTKTSSSNQSFWKSQVIINASYTALLKNRWGVDIIQGLGLLYSSKPAYTSNYDNIVISPDNVASKNGLDIGYTIGVKGRFLLKENIGFTTSINYFHAVGLGSNYSSFDSVDCELGIVFNLNKSSIKK
jgi:hypothetical protein